MFTKRNALIELARDRIADEAFQHYLRWREESATCKSAYAVWATATSGERDLAFATYTAALDGEAQAASQYETALAGGGSR